MKKVALLMLIGLVCIPSLNAKYKKARSVDSFYGLLARAPYAVALFYDKSKDNMRDEAIRRSIKDLEIMFRSLSKNPAYKEADLQFIRVDVARRDLSSLAEQYRIRYYPTAMTFVGRELVGQPIAGKLYREQLQSLINQNLGQKMQAVMKEKQKQRQRELQRARIRAYQWAAWGPYWYGGYGGYYGYRPYWGRGYGRPWGGVYFGW